MTPDDLDRILSSDDSLEPSSGFLKNVMAAVQQAPEEFPRTFPWLRFVTGLIALLVMAAAGTLLLMRWGPALTPLAVRLEPFTALAQAFGYVVAATLLTLCIAAIPWLRVRP